MTFIPDLITDHEDIVTAEPIVMTLVDENGQETPITEFDIQTTLRQMAETENEYHRYQTLDMLMERADAARAIA